MVTEEAEASGLWCVCLSLFAAPRPASPVPRPLPGGRPALRVHPCKRHRGAPGKGSPPAPIVAAILLHIRPSRGCYSRPRNHYTFFNATETAPSSLDHVLLICSLNPTSAQINVNSILNTPVATKVFVLRVRNPNRLTHSPQCTSLTEMSTSPIGPCSRCAPLYLTM